MVILCLLTAIAIPLHAQDVPQSTGTISGVVRRQGTNVALALVSVRVLGTNRGTCTNGDGSYTITQIPLDTAYTIVSGDSFCTGNETLWVPEYWQETVNQENATPITLTSPAPNRTGIDFTVQRGGVVLGVVKDAAGVPLANIGVGAWDGTTWRSVCTNATGNYQIYPIPLYAAFTVEAGQDVRVECGGSLDYHREFWQEKTSYEDATRLTLTDSVVNIGGIDFTLELGGTISGR
ncbi:MAG: carboxypeptidase-like regulatory domain-containing protein, partial [Chloroflexota bacterium]|nr:carboxypeptidase-like regulatory domain-containing protein [Chloroflexota bacterium]